MQTQASSESLPETSVGFFTAFITAIGDMSVTRFLSGITAIKPYDDRYDNQTFPSRTAI